MAEIQALKLSILYSKTKNKLKKIITGKPLETCSINYLLGISSSFRLALAFLLKT